MSNSDLRKIREVAEHHTMDPSPEAWDKLNLKLKAKKTKIRLINYRNISIAAVLVSVLSVTALLTVYLDDHNPEVFATNEDYRPIALEELAVDEVDPIYDVGNIGQLLTAYTDSKRFTF